MVQHVLLFIAWSEVASLKAPAVEIMITHWEEEKTSDLLYGTCREPDKEIPTHPVTNDNDQIITRCPFIASFPGGCQHISQTLTKPHNPIVV